MAEITECEHMTAIKLGPSDHVAVVAPREIVDDYNALADVLEEWWPDHKVLLLDDRFQVLAITDDTLVEHIGY